VKTSGRPECGEPITDEDRVGLLEGGGVCPMLSTICSYNGCPPLLSSSQRDLKSFFNAGAGIEFLKAMLIQIAIEVVGPEIK